MGIIGCFNELHVHAHGIAALLHTSFQDVSDAKLRSDVAQILRHAFVMLRGRTRDHLQIGDLRQARQNFVLDTVGKVGIGFVVAPVFERKYGYTFFRHKSRRTAGLDYGSATKEN